MAARTNLSVDCTVDFPLRGEWRALNTPAERVPSHGTDYFGQRYAFDFVQMDPEGVRYAERGLLAQWLGILPADTFLSWGRPVLSAFAGRVTAVGDGWPDRERVNAIREVIRNTVAPPRPVGNDYRPLAGNFVIVEGSPGTALYAHLRNGSVCVRPGHAVASGEPIGRVGNSGNSTMPHLHFQVMDGPDPLRAAGVPCAFTRYERYEKGSWITVTGGVPGPLERIRVV